MIAVKLSAAGDEKPLHRAQCDNCEWKDTHWWFCEKYAEDALSEHIKTCGSIARMFAKSPVVEK